ncbi:alanine--glyoxylate aminotransferase, partial [Oleiphilus sp. HI0081]
GMRMKEVATRAGAQVEAIEFEWGEAVEPEVVDQKLSENPDISMIAFVHAETSTGVRSDAKALCAIAQQHNCLSIVDAVTSLGGSDVQVDDWGIDAIYSGTQKCLSCIPGLSPVSFSTKAIEKIKAKSSKNYSWFLDLNLVMDYWGEGAKRTYHHTAPVNSLYALHESLLILKEEGLESAWERHELHHKALVAGLEALGIEMLVPKDIRLSQLNAVKIPEGIDDATVRSTLLNQYDLELGAGLGKFAGKAWRIGLMGNGCNRKNVDYCVSSLGAVLNELGHSCDVDAAMSAVENAYP